VRSAVQLGLMLALLHTFIFQLDQALHQQQSMPASQGMYTTACGAGHPAASNAGGT